MSDLWDSGGGSGIVSSGIQVANTVMNQQQYNKNLNFAKKQLNYQRDLQRQMFAREDSAVQRRVADLRAAGLSPVLAAGAGASAGPVVSTETPRGERAQIPDLAQNALALMQMEKNIQRTDLDLARTQTENSIAQKDLEIYELTDMNPRTAKGVIGEAAQLVSPITKMYNKLKKWHDTKFTDALFRAGGKK